MESLEPETILIESTFPADNKARITIDDKLKIIELLEEKKMSRIEVAEQYNMSKSTISKIMKNKKKYTASSAEFCGKVRMRRLKYYELEAPLFRYSFLYNFSSSFIVSLPQLFVVSSKKQRKMAQTLPET